MEAVSLTGITPVQMLLENGLDKMKKDYVSFFIGVSSYQELIACFTLVLESLECGEIQPWIHHGSGSLLSKLIQQSYHGKMEAVSLTGITPVQMLLENGLDKMKKDYVSFFIGVSSYQELIACFTLVLESLECGEIQPWIHHGSGSLLSKLIQQSYHGKMEAVSLTGITPVQMLLENGLDKMKKDYVSFFIESHPWTLGVRLGQAELFLALQSSLIRNALQCKLCLPKRVSTQPRPSCWREGNAGAAVEAQVVLEPSYSAACFSVLRVVLPMQGGRGIKGTKTWFCHCG
ncbi:uncharacterized protein AAGF69_012598 isoform 4-T16 [Amazona ochrocephala]